MTHLYKVSQETLYHKIFEGNSSTFLLNDHLNKLSIFKFENGQSGIQNTSETSTFNKFIMYIV